MSETRFRLLIPTVGTACASLRVIRRVCWSTLLLCLFFLNPLRTSVSAQQIDSAQIQTEDQLFFALLTAATTDPSTTETLLSNHKDLVHVELWKRLIDTAEYSPQPLAIYALAFQVVSELADRRLAGITLYKSGWYQFGQGNIEIAISNYLQSKNAFEETNSRRDLIYILADLGTLYIYSSDYNKAKEYSERSLVLAEQVRGTAIVAAEFPDEYGMGTALSNLGNISKREGDYDKAIDCFQKALALFKKINLEGTRYSSQIIDALADLGRTYLARGDYLRALSYLDKAMDLANSCHDVNRMAGIDSSIGILYTNQRDYPKAIEFFQQGLVRATGVNDRFKQASMLLNIGVAFQFQKNYEQALENFQKSLALAKILDDKEVLIHVGEGMGAVYKEQGRYSEALDALEKSLLLAKSIGDRVRISELLWRKAEVCYANGNFAATISSATEAVVLAQQLSLRNVSYLALTELGKAYRANKQDQLASETFLRAIDGIEEMRNQVAGLEQESQLFFEDKIEPYQEMVDLSLNHQGSESVFRALTYAERAKGRVLLDVLDGGRIDPAKTMSQQEKEDERKLNTDIVILNRKVSEQIAKPNSDARVLTALNAQLHAARIKYEAFQDSLYAAHPEMRTKHGRATTLASSDLNDLVEKGKTAFLEYVVTKSKTHLFVLTKSQSDSVALKHYSIDITEENLLNKARKFRQMIASQDPAFPDMARQLYELLLKPAEDQLKGNSTLCIVPDGILWDLPFQALLVGDSRYLVEDYSIYYAPSLGVIKEMSAQNAGSKRMPQSLLAFANPRLENSVTENLTAVYRGEVLAPLPDSEMEANALQQIWTPAHSKVFVGSNAGEKSFKIQAGNYSVIHLATHGILDDSNPLYSRLVMSRDANDPEDDGLLEAREIMQLKLRADLVVLSACQTARGRFGAGEGMVGMSWAFFLAGVPTMVASQWKVDSVSTAKLMIEFHRMLKDQTANGGSTKANALRHSALELMKEPRYRHPFFWAGFVMIGNGN